MCVGREGLWVWEENTCVWDEGMWVWKEGLWVREEGMCVGEEGTCGIVYTYMVSVFSANQNITMCQYIIMMSH